MQTFHNSHCSMSRSGAVSTPRGSHQLERNSRRVAWRDGVSIWAVEWLTASAKGLVRDRLGRRAAPPPDDTQRSVHLRAEHPARIDAPSTHATLNAPRRQISLVERLAAENCQPKHGLHRTIRPHPMRQTTTPAPASGGGSHPRLPALRPLPLQMHRGRSCCSRWSRSSRRNAGRARCGTRRYGR